MRFSFTIPSYNYGNRLANALDSILAQVGEDYEILIVDDGSQDNTAAVAKTYTDRYPKRIRYYWQENQGPAAARHFAATQASGEFLFPLDSDDQLQPDALIIMRQALNDHPKADLIIAQTLVISENGSQQIKLLPPLSLNNEKNFSAYLRKEFSIPNGAHILRRQTIQRIQYPLHILRREDIVFFAQILAHFTAVTINKPVVTIHKHRDSFRHQLDKYNDADEIINTLFNPAILPATLMKYKKEFSGRLYLSFFRDYYQAGDYAMARRWYWRAIKIHPLRLMQWSYFSKLLRSFTPT